MGAAASWPAAVPGTAAPALAERMSHCQALSRRPERRRWSPERVGAASEHRTVKPGRGRGPSVPTPAQAPSRDVRKPGPGGPLCPWRPACRDPGVRSALFWEPRQGGQGQFRLWRRVLSTHTGEPGVAQGPGPPGQLCVEQWCFHPEAQHARRALSRRGRRIRWALALGVPRSSQEAVWQSGERMWPAEELSEPPCRPSTRGLEGAHEQVTA